MADAALQRAGLYHQKIHVLSEMSQSIACSVAKARRELGYLHLQLFSIRRAADKLKYLAGSESAMGAFVSDVRPEDVAQRLRDLAR